MGEVIEVGSSIGHYRIVSKIGAGGMGEVYLAHDARLDREVAIKVLPAEISQRRRPSAAFRAGSKGDIRAKSPKHPHRLRHRRTRRLAVHRRRTARRRRIP